MKLKIALLGGLLLAGANAMACYTVYDGNNRVLYQGVQAPVDMSMALHEALVQRGFPRGAQMVFDQGSNCRPIGVAQVPRPSAGEVPLNTIRLERSRQTLRPGSSSSPAPLFTDRETAERSGVPHTTVAGDVVVVPPVVADRVVQAAVTVLPASTFTGTAPGAPDTTAMGAGPARPTANRRATTRPNVVITELRDPPMTIIEGGGGVTVNRY